MGSRDEPAESASSSWSMLGAVDGLLTSALVVCIGIAFIVDGNLNARIVGLLILSPWLYLGTRHWVRQRGGRGSEPARKASRR
jgi:hypothetical protein